MNSKFAERATPLAAAVTALAAFACCVPLGFAGAIGVLAVGSLFNVLQPWFMAAAVALLALGAWLSFRARRGCRTRGRRFSLAVLSLSATVVLLVLFFPQTVAGWIADYVL
jgi:hypothetical protein